ncbi:HAMP domain-containing histidine kinase [Candidatus Parcubacteria bacterium]|uniref:histidine kinase n=1 Tax=Candidatus Kaiserbacteria bacterium CG10_big_fil_rev_8_21_14_0_10_47_16 TaxID=1974608 RepID=A0A2H0UG26_9BACT|nr:HAMP domain-containing histidine kinase [Candidatus Parcubacteria bacterium]PIR84755.1 MAG: hypothetical protein COU16_01035 [Candidatus Kaiserbacteria bacterium CG10_big_fil_rev_8_21_14_0_10_47_16]
MNEQLCPWDAATYLIFSDNVPSLLFYSHFTAVIVSLFLAVFLLVKKRNVLEANILSLLLIIFSAWAIIDVIVWATNRPDVVMFGWGTIVLIEPIIYALAFYLLYVFVHQKFPRFRVNLGIFIILFPLLALTPTYLNLTGINLYDCTAAEGPLALYYTYVLEFIFIIGILFIAIRRIFAKVSRDEKQKAIYLALGVIAFLAAFASGNIIGSTTGNWDLAQYGLFGMPIFIGVLTYLVVQYRLFNLKVFGSQALVLTLWVLIGSLLFVVRSDQSRIIAALTLLFTILFGIRLIRSVKREIAAREQLALANQRQKNLIHSMNHQIKGRFLNNRIVFDELLNNAKYDAFPDAVKTMLSQGYDDSTRALEYVQGILKGASAESGQLPYDMKPMNFKEVVEKTIADQKEKIEKKGLTLTTHIEDSGCDVVGDAVQLGEVVRNLIENAWHYNSPKGSVTINLVCENRAAHLSVQDTGIGIAEEDKARIFTSGGRGKESTKYNTDSSGYGLAFAKAVTEAHGGKIWFTANKPEQGTTFHIEIPLKQG